MRVNIFRESHRQTIQYIQPQDHHKLGQAELVVIDEAAAIPLPLVKALMGPYLVFMASTIHGYEGTGRSLSLKLIKQLREQNSAAASGAATSGRVLREIKLDTPIRYAAGDPVEAWLEGLLCLTASTDAVSSTTCPVPTKCELYEVNRDTLFSYNSVSETFLHKMMGLYVSSHYKNTPNDLQLLSDAPAHRIFCLLGPVDPASSSLPEILCVVQLALEGEISKDSAQAAFSRGIKMAGDMIPWTVAQQYQDDEFPRLSGARVVRIATHPDFQGMGYGKRTVDLLTSYYQGMLTSLSETPKAAPAAKKPERLAALEARTNLPPLLTRAADITPESLDYLGVSFGLTQRLFKFWKVGGFVPVYLRQGKNDLTGEHSTIMVKPLENGSADTVWVDKFWIDFQRRFSSLLSMCFRNLAPQLALSVVAAKRLKARSTPLSAAEIPDHLTPFDLKRLHSYSTNLLDYHAILDLVPVLAKLWLSGAMSELSFTAVQRAILVGVGFQRKSIDELATELGSGQVQTSQLMALFSQAMRKFNKHLRALQTAALDSSVPASKRSKGMDALSETLESAQDSAAAEVSAKFGGDLSRYAIPAEQESEFAKALAASGGAAPSTLSIKSSKKTKKYSVDVDALETEDEPVTKKMKHGKKSKHSKN